MNLTIGASGHRPKRIAAQHICYSERVMLRLTALCKRTLEILLPDEVVVGGALGFDTAMALAAMDLRGIKIFRPRIVLLKPFAGQEKKWPQSSQRRYREIEAAADEVIVGSEGGYSAAAMDKRNRMVIERSDRIVGLWDGIRQGGTWNAYQYCSLVGVRFENIWNSWEKYSGVELPAAQR